MLEIVLLSAGVLALCALVVLVGVEYAAIQSHGARYAAAQSTARVLPAAEDLCRFCRRAPVCSRSGLACYDCRLSFDFE